MSTNAIVLYQPDGEIAGIEVMVEDDTVWLTLEQMAQLFGKSKSTVNEHVLNVYREGELSEKNTKRKIGNSDFSTKPTNFYNLDVIISVGYRVKSQRGTQFRIWATGVLRSHLLQGYTVNQRFECIEDRVGKLEEQVSFFVQTALPPVEGIFYEGQIFDAYGFAAKLVKSAHKRIVLFDNYIDESVLMLLAKRRDGVLATIHCGKVGGALLTDAAKHNEQYHPIEIVQTRGIHDRFLMVDDMVYHLGASVKDLGKKLFAFSRLNISLADILGKCNSQ